MKSFLIAFTIGTVVMSSSSSFAGNTYSTQQCKTWFNTLDRNKDGSLGSAENADGFLARITLGSETESGGGTYIMSKAFFVAECSIGSLGRPTP